MKNLRATLTVMIALLLMLSIGAAPTEASHFSDLKGEEQTEAVHSLVEKDIIKGYEDGTFRPNTPVSRSQVVKFLGRWLQYNGYMVPEDAATERRFEDVDLKNDVELANLAALVQEESIFLGSEGYLDGSGTMQRKHMALVLVRSIKSVYGNDLIQEYKAANFQPTVKDLDKAGGVEQKEAIIALDYADLTNVEVFNPSGTITRGQFVAFLHRTIEKYHQNGTEEETPSLPAFDPAGSNTITIASGTPLYSSRNMKNVIGTWQDGERPVIFNSIEDEGILVIRIAGEKYYIFSNQGTIQTERPVSDVGEAIGAVRTTNDFTILSEPHGRVLMKGLRQTNVEVLRVENGFYVVETAAGIGYIPINQAAPNSKSNLIIHTDTPLLIKSGSTYNQIGTLKANAVVKPNGASGQYRVISANGKSYFFDQTSALETTKTVSLGKLIKAVFPTRLIAEKDATIKTASDQLVGTLKKGQDVTLLNIDGQAGLIEFAGGTGRVNLSEFIHSDLVSPKKSITHKEMSYHLKVISMLYPEFTELVQIDTSTEGRAIYALRLGNGKKEILMDASMHAREHMTTNVLLEMIDQYSYHYVRSSKFGSYNVKRLLDQTKIWFIPMMNPDGVTLVQGGPNAVKSGSSVRKINNSTNFARWKANIRGVDLNRNFEGGWRYEDTTNGPAYKNYKGPFVFSERESKAFRNFVSEHTFKSYISYHSSGQIIYWSHNQGASAAKRDRALATKISGVTGYKVMAPLNDKGSGTSTDWFIQTYKMPGITVEIAPFVGEKPVPISYWDRVWAQNKTIGLLSAQEANAR
ncbi:M14 family zinc carboxypeptidase [Chungangia koreensis]|uniref:M14 family zinc carboxypeptidase n=1 Tax=Chungangia koreensis TaxID=752657 RepID=A0ABV8X9H3_9LACT